MYRSCSRRTAVALVLLLTLTLSTGPLSALPLPVLTGDAPSAQPDKSFFAPLWELLASLWAEPTATPLANTGGGTGGTGGTGGAGSLNTGSCIDPMGAPRCQI